MKRLFLLAVCSLIFVSAHVLNAQITDSKALPNQFPYCHKGTVIWLNIFAIPAHVAHGDVPAVMNAAGQWVCPPCVPQIKHPKTFCPDGTLQSWYWDPTSCQWVPKDCCPKPTYKHPKTFCPDGTLQQWTWDQSICRWLPIDCCPKPTYNQPPDIKCPDGSVQVYYWDASICKWVVKPCACDQPTTPKPPCPDGTTNCCWEWNKDKCDWVLVPCPCQPDPATQPHDFCPGTNTVQPSHWDFVKCTWILDPCPPACPIPGALCCWILSANGQWILVDCNSGQPIPCGTIINGTTITCGCFNSTGYVPCP